MIKKSNIDYVREYIETHGSITLKAETIEFLNAVQEEMDELKTELESSKDEVSTLEVDNIEKDFRITKLEEEDDNFFTVDCGIGKIEWRSNSLVLQSKMEEFTNKIASSYIQNQVTLF